MVNKYLGLTGELNCSQGKPRLGTEQHKLDFENGKIKKHGQYL